MSNPLKNGFSGPQVNPQMMDMVNNPQMQLVDCLPYPSFADLLVVH